MAGTGTSSETSTRNTSTTGAGTAASPHLDPLKQLKSPNNPSTPPLCHPDQRTALSLRRRSFHVIPTVYDTTISTQEITLPYPLVSPNENGQKHLKTVWISSLQKTALFRKLCTCTAWKLQLLHAVSASRLGWLINDQSTTLNIFLIKFSLGYTYFATLRTPSATSTPTT